MMLAIRVEFLHGTVRAGSPDDIAMTGLEDPGEWPPSPARLFQALVSAEGTGARCSVTDGNELVPLESAPPPTMVADGPEQVLRSRIRPRFVVVDRHSKGTVHNYPARDSEEVRPSTRMAPRAAEVAYIWPNLSLSPAEIAALERRAARVSYLGCSDSPVRMSIHETLPLDAARTWRPDDSGPHAIPVPYPGFTKALDTAYDKWLAGPTRRAWLRTERARYASPGEQIEAHPQPFVFWLRFEGSVPGRLVLQVTQTLRAAVLELYQRAFGDHDVPAVLHGHGFERRGYNHTQWLALPDAGFEHSTGRIHGAAVWLPPNTHPEIIACVRTSLGELTELVCPGRFSLMVRTHGGEQRPLAARPDRWTRRSRRWVSVFPVVHERWSTRGPDKQEIERWLAHAGFTCEVLRSKESSAPLLNGSKRLRPEEVHREGRSHHPYSFFELELDRDIEGPLIIGRGRQFGLGLTLPTG